MAEDPADHALPRSGMVADPGPSSDAGNEAAHELLQAVALINIEQTPPSRKLLAIAILVSLSLHIALAASALEWNAAVSEYGVLTEETDAMSLEATQTLVLEATFSQPTEALSSLSAAAMLPGGAPSSSAEATPVPEPLPLVKEPPPEVIETTDFLPEPVKAIEPSLSVISGSAEAADNVVAAAEELPDEIDEVEEAKELKAEEDQRAETELQEEAKKRSEKKKQQQSASQMAGGATSKANAGQASASGRVSASRGSVLRFAARVRAKVARNKPIGRGHHGTARISFSVTHSGELGFARLSQSSGNAHLDRAAIEAVRRAAPFGLPPPGVSTEHLRFSIPFYFR